MEQEKKSFVHDTINLDEIRSLLGDADLIEDWAVPGEDTEAAAEETAQETLLPDEPASVLPEEPEMPDMEEEAEEEEEAAGSDLLDEEAESDANAEAEDAAPVEAAVPSEAETALQEEEVDPDEYDPAAKKERKPVNLAQELYAMIHDVIYLLAAVTLIFVFVIRLVGVSGDSMLPTLHNQDILLLESNFLYNGDDYSYGDIVVLSVPHYEEQGEGPIVKRIIATEGDTVDIDFETGAVYVNGVMLRETYINDMTHYNWDGEFGMQYPATVPENCIFVLGDNRNNSMDSRYAPIGMVDERCVLGKVLVVGFPGQTVDSLGNVIDPRDWGRIGLVS